MAREHRMPNSDLVERCTEAVLKWRSAVVRCAPPVQRQVLDSELYGEFEVLSLVGSRRQRLADLALTMGVEPPLAQATVEELASRGELGLLEGRSPELIMLTVCGARRLRQLRDAYRSGFEGMAESLGLDQRRRLAAAIDALLSASHRAA